mmetsp:Transcript_33784/g.32849  ORF Transcript_33784/g.32849 Transcript_33784/m.32849 type:complete len:170 (+) Transcript_33784:138-647(+)
MNFKIYSFYNQRKQCNSIMPIIYFLIQILCIVILFTSSDYLRATEETKTQTFLFWAFTLLTFIFYCLSAFRNPGYLLGNQFYEVANVGSYTPNTASDVNKKDPYSSSENNFNLALKKYGHQRKTSMLTQGLQMSRHDRGKSKSSVGSVNSEMTTENLDLSPNLINTLSN